jgi:hypothetical protein
MKAKSTYTPAAYFVICRSDSVEGIAGERVLATQRVFPTLDAAWAYAKGVNRNRQPMVVKRITHERRITGL